MAGQKMYKQAIVSLLGERPRAYYVSLAKALRSPTTAIMLSQLLYWHGIIKDDPDRDGGWFYKSVPEFYDETGLTKREQKTARDRLVALQLIDAKLRGIPRVWYYRVNLDAIAEFMSNNMQPPLARKRPNVGSESAPILETLTPQLNKESRTTHEITHMDAKILAECNRLWGINLALKSPRGEELCQYLAIRPAEETFDKFADWWGNKHAPNDPPSVFNLLESWEVAQRFAGQPASSQDRQQNLPEGV